MLTELVVAVVGSGAVSAIVTWLTTRRKNNADATKILVDSAVAVLAPYRDLPRDLAALREENHVLQLANARLEAVVEDLKKQLHAERELSIIREREFNASIRVLMDRFGNGESPATGSRAE